MFLEPLVLGNLLAGFLIQRLRSHIREDGFIPASVGATRVCSNMK